MHFLFILSLTFQLCLADYCRLKSQTSCVGSLRTYTLIGNIENTNPFYNDGNGVTDINTDYKITGSRFKVGFVDIDNGKYKRKSLDVHVYC